MKLRYSLALLLFVSSAYGEDNRINFEGQLQTTASKVEFFGDILATVTFCNLGNYVDQYELAAGFHFFGITRADEKPIDVVRQRQYQRYRTEIRTLSQHEPAFTG